MIAAESKDKRLPPWLKRQVGKSEKVADLKRILRENNLHTVCEEARCPNLGECFEQKRATFLILGDYCTRGCGFCSVKEGRPLPPEPDEPQKVAAAAARMGAKYVVITSVTRDDLPDGGSKQFAHTIDAIRKLLSDSSIEALTPDFGGDIEAIDRVCHAGPDVYNHNVETVPSLYPEVRPRAEYERSLDLIRHVKKSYPSIMTKSGLMLGFGEKRDEVITLLEDLKNAGCDLVTIGQYMRPTKNNLQVVEYVKPEVFKELECIGKEMGFAGIFSGPLVRSSFNAEEFRMSIDS
ncbi:MAG: lipoyl synthase [Deltaproteobacteria bacterium]|nr:lipoyl synthase [Deltaproteobacteria bacterium]